MTLSPFTGNLYFVSVFRTYSQNSLISAHQLNSLIILFLHCIWAQFDPAKMAALLYYYSNIPQTLTVSSFECIKDVGRGWSHNTPASHYGLIVFTKKNLTVAKCVWNIWEIMKNQQPISLIALFLVAQNIISQGQQCYTAECMWAYGAFWDNKSLCNQAAAQLHIWLILPFWRTADKTVPALRYTSGRIAVFLCIQLWDGDWKPASIAAYEELV